MKYTVNPFTGDLVPCSNPVSNSLQQRSINFDFSTPSPTLLRTTQGNSRILEIIVGIDIPFNGSGWSLSVGDSNNNQNLVTPSQVALDQLDKFELFSGFFYAVPTQINLYIFPGSATTGVGFIYLSEV